MAKWKSTQSTGLRQDPKKAQEWQERSRQKAIQKLRERGAKLAPKEPRPNGTTAGALVRTAVMPRGALTGSGSPESPQRRAQNRKPKQNDGPWRAACIMARGEFCRCCGKGQIQMDHIKPKGQGGKSDVENGLPLCEEHHRMKTDSEIVIEWAWLDPDQLVYLAKVGWVDWDAEGKPFGRGWKHFGDRPVSKTPGVIPAPGISEGGQ